MRPVINTAVRRLAPVAVVALAAAGLSAAGALAAPARPTLQVVSTGDLTVVRGPGEPLFGYGLGLYTVAGSSPVEFRTVRARTGPVVSVRRRLADGTLTAPTAGLTTDVNRLTGFSTLVIKDAAGRTVARRTLGFCPDDYGAARARPDAPATSPYPVYCGSHPFALAGVFGIQAGWSVPVVGYDFGSGDDVYFDLPDGTYTAQATVNPGWRSALGITIARGGRAETKIKLVTDPNLGDGGGEAAPAATTGHDHAAHAHAATGPVSKQRADLTAAHLRALGKAAKPAAAPPAPGIGRAAAASVPQPDLRSRPAFGIVLDPRQDANGRPTGKTDIDFSATVWNAGPSPLVVDGFRRPGQPLMDAYQYFFDGQGNQVGSAPAGTLEWDPRTGHHHWHFTAFATYRLLDASRTVAVRSGKEAFCLVPTDPINLTVRNANWKPFSTDLSTACGTEGALSLREVLDAGHGDTYVQDLPGQSFDITNLPNGTYWIEVRANPDNKLTESRTDNNVAMRKVLIGGTPGGARTLRVPPYYGLNVP